MFNLGPMELVVILVLALLIFGPGKLPEVGKALGKGLNEFRRATRAIESAANDAARQPAVGVKPEASSERAAGGRPDEAPAPAVAPAQEGEEEPAVPENGRPL